MKTERILHSLRIGVPEISEEILGGNSSVFKGKLPDGTLLAIKEYKGNQPRIERMLSREERAIGFLRGRGFQNVPEILEVRGDLGLIVYRWIEGKAPSANHESMSAIIGMCEALHELHEQGLGFDNAVDAAFSLSEINSQVSTRIQEFEDGYSFASVRDLCENLRDRLHLCIGENGPNNTFIERTLSVSDLGTHNIIHSGSSYQFIDFEFFGLDSVSKLVGDFMLHPRNEFDEAEVSRFIKAISQISEWDSTELIDVMPLLTLKWAVIAFGRTFRESSFETTAVITEKQIHESNGFLYLRYFDSQRRSAEKDLISTFRSFAGKIAKP